jgi:hypothetical protein
VDHPNGLNRDRLSHLHILKRLGDSDRRGEDGHYPVSYTGHPELLPLTLQYLVSQTEFSMTSKRVHEDVSPSSFFVPSGTRPCPFRFRSFADLDNQSFTFSQH